MRQHAFEFLVGKQVQNPFGYRNRGVLWVASGRKCVGRIGRDNVYLGHWDADLLRKALDDLVSARQLFARDRLRAVHGQRDLVAKEIRNEVHDDGQRESDLHATLAAEDLSHKQQEKRQRGQQ